MKLDKVIEKFINENGLGIDSGNKLADHCGLSRGYLAVLRKGVNPKNGQTVDPGISVLQKLAEGMGMSLERLLYESEITSTEGVELDLSKLPEFKKLLQENGIEYLSVSEDARRQGITPKMLRELVETIGKMRQ